MNAVQSNLIGNLFTNEGVYVRPVTQEEIKRNGYMKVHYCFISNPNGILNQDAIAFHPSAALLAREFNKPAEAIFIGYLQTN
jgi:hypothetical protein